MCTSKHPRLRRLRPPSLPEPLPLQDAAENRMENRLPVGTARPLISRAGQASGGDALGPIQILAVDTLPLGKHAQSPAVQRTSLFCFPPPCAQPGAGRDPICTRLGTGTLGLSLAHPRAMSTGSTALNHPASSRRRSRGAEEAKSHPPGGLSGGLNSAKAWREGGVDRAM